MTSKILLKLGAFFLVSSVGLFLFIFYPVLVEEGKFWINYFDKRSVEVSVYPQKTDSTQKKVVIAPVDTKFTIVIPKIRANAKVLRDVDPNSPAIYQQALSQGVAHAKGSSYPGRDGNTFLFAHSSANFYEANRYNSIFYLLYKLEKDDVVYLFYDGVQHQYTVLETKTVESNEVKYISEGVGRKSLTLMTCWPPGTDLQRFIVQAIEE